MMRTLSLSLALSIGAVPAFADQAPRAGVAGVVPSAQMADAYSVFVPRPSNNRRFDYKVWDSALQDMVLDLGPSLRKREGRPASQTSSRLQKGHDSPLRLEGSRFTFAYVSDDFQRGLGDYRKDLEELGTRYDIASLPKDEQLAYWLNLHNVALIEKVSEAYPVRRPSRIDLEVGGVKTPLDRAKFITVKGVPLSLKDIRTKIVYPNWPERPETIYGFFRGDIGSPSLAKTAYTGSSVTYLTSDNAEEFINSLRGFELGRSERKVSEIYREAAPFYFPDLDTDLIAHMKKWARPEVEDELARPLPVAFAKYEDDVADLSGGNRLGADAYGRASLSYEARQTFTETRDKYKELIREGYIGSGNTGTVIIEDIDTEDLAPDPRYSPLLESDPSETP